MMCPTLITINGRFVFSIGGFEDVNFEIHRLDMRSSHMPWVTLTLDTKQSIVDSSIYTNTQNYLNTRREQTKLTDLKHR